MDANKATLSMLQSVPGIGKKRAMAIVRNRPFRDAEDAWRLFDEPRARESAQFHLTFSKVDKE
jgi:radical SAM superfamily enzyme with C-terminal helix-hairpin-helix motif